MYHTHRLRSNLQEWRNRLYKSNYQTFSSYYSQFMDRLQQEPLLSLLLKQSTDAYPLLESELKGMDEKLARGINFKTGQHAAATLYQTLISYASMGYSPNALVDDFGGYSGTHSERIVSFVDKMIEPIVHYLHDSIEETSFVLYLLERYKKRTEWFMASTLNEKYSQATSNYEQIFEDDLRLFLFDQGIDYPFSTPKSNSGRADIVGQLHTDDPLVLEVKIYDSERKYKKNRVIDGFKQIVEYANNYNKTTGYLVVYNLDPIEILINTSSGEQTFPQRVIFNNKVYYIIFINLNYKVSASKRGQQKVEVIEEDDLFAPAERL